MRKIIGGLMAVALAVPALAEPLKFKSDRVVTMDALSLQECVTLKYGSPLIVTRYDEASTRLGISYAGHTFSTLVLTPVDGGTRVRRAGNPVGEQLLKKCAGARA